jgi:hypothetical protein
LRLKLLLLVKPNQTQRTTTQAVYPVFLINSNVRMERSAFPTLGGVTETTIVQTDLTNRHAVRIVLWIIIYCGRRDDDLSSKDIISLKLFVLNFDE